MRYWPLLRGNTVNRTINVLLSKNDPYFCLHSISGICASLQLGETTGFIVDIIATLGGSVPSLAEKPLQK